VVDRVIRQAFVIYVAANMAACAILFAPWAQPRETISGLLGRWSLMESGWKRAFALVLSRVVDSIYFWEEEHCASVFHVEREAREILYP
jgi:hypothetical protein